MVAPAMLLRGIVKDGLIVPRLETPLPEGTEVEFRVLPEELPQDLRSELAVWEDASADSFQMILDLEREERDASR